MKKGQTECFKSYNYCGIPKALTKYVGLSWAAPQIVSFFQLAAEKKTPFLTQLKQIFDLSDFVRALVVKPTKIHS